MDHWIMEPIKCKLCGKLAYDTREDAEYAAKSHSLKVYPYLCKYGNGWHLSQTASRDSIAVWW